MKKISQMKRNEIKLSRHSSLVKAGVVTGSKMSKNGI